MIGRTNAGSGGAGLNFKVVGNPQPSSPAENTIWVNTDIPIPSYALSAAESEEPSEGMVWIKIGNSSPVGFSVLKKNAVYVYPISAMQYIDGAWVAKTAMSYIDGEWVGWIVYLYNKGDECSNITGGWSITNRYTGSTYRAPSITRGSDSMTVSSSVSTINANNENGCVETNNAIDLTDYTTLTFVVSNCQFSTDWDGNMNYAYLGVAKDGSGSFSFAASVKVTESGTFSVDVSSLDGDYVVVINTHQNMSNGSLSMLYSQVTISGIYLT